MAKSRKRNSETRRDASVIASGPRPLLASIDPLRSGRSLTAIEDRRLFTPGIRRPMTPRQVARVLMRPPSRRGSRKAEKLHSPEVYAFHLPRTTAICVRRAIRKQVIHALGVAGSKVRRPKRNQYSKISCRRR